MVEQVNSTSRRVGSWAAVLCTVFSLAYVFAQLAEWAGLLGSQGGPESSSTVLGIAEAFRRVSQSGMGKPEALAGGIDLALTTTIAGLCVAIPAMVLAAWLQGRIRRLALWTDERLAPVVEQIAARPSVAAEDHHAA